MEWHVETRKLSEIREFSKNARYLSSHDGDHLEKSIERFGLCEPLVLNLDGTLIGGHQRYRLLRKLKKDSAAVYLPERELSEAEVEELNIRLNKNVGSYDHDVLSNMWDPADLIEFGFTLEELTFDDATPEEDSAEKKPQALMSTLTIYFQEPGDLERAEHKIAAIVEEFPGARYKTKAK